MKKFLALLLAAHRLRQDCDALPGRNHRSHRNCGTRRSRGRNSG